MLKCAFVLLPLFACSCKGDFIIDERIESHQEERIVSCTISGFCYGCGLGFDGKYECKVGFHSDCPGNRRAIVQVMTVKGHYENEPNESFTKTDARINTM